MGVFLDLLRQLHDGPPQHAAAVRVALAVWEQAVERGDADGARQAVFVVRQALGGLIESLVSLQTTGRRWSGRPSPSPAELAGARQAAAEWEARVARQSDDTPPDA